MIRDACRVVKPSPYGVEERRLPTARGPNNDIEHTRFKFRVDGLENDLLRWTSSECLQTFSSQCQGKLVELDWQTSSLGDRLLSHHFQARRNVPLWLGGTSIRNRCWFQIFQTNDRKGHKENDKDRHASYGNPRPVLRKAEGLDDEIAAVAGAPRVGLAVSEWAFVDAALKLVSNVGAEGIKLTRSE